jgi:hypothetical protein
MARHRINRCTCHRQRRIESAAHGLINYKANNEKCCHLKKNCGRCLTEFIDWRVFRRVYRLEVMLVFSTQLCELLPLTPSLGLVQLSPLPRVNKYGF